MRKITFVFLMLPLGAACTGATNPFTAPLPVLVSMENPTRGPVEVFVKTNHPALIRDIRAGGGPALSEAYTIAQTPLPARLAHTVQLQSNLQLYAANPGALVAAIIAVSGA